MRAFHGSARRYGGAEAGNIAMLFALALAPVLLGAGLAIDFARAGHARAVVQEAADAALLRAARLRSQQPDITEAALTAAARRIFDAGVGSLAGMSYDGFEVRFVEGAETITLAVDAALESSILKAVGLRALDVDTTSEVKPGKRPYLEVVLALDNTGSMNDSGKLQDLKDSASGLVESIFTTPHSGVLVGLAPFAQYVNVGAANSGADWLTGAGAGWGGCVGSRAYPANIEDADYVAHPVPAATGVPCPAPVMALTDDKAAALAAINSMTADGYTYIASGLAWGWRMLSPQAPFSEGVTYEELEARAGIKALIVLTDGANTRAPSYPLHASGDVALANSLTASLCDAVKEDGVTLFAIAFAVTDATIKSLLEDCATTPGHYFDAGDDDALDAAFVEIGMTLRSLSLSR